MTVNKRRRNIGTRKTATSIIERRRYIGTTRITNNANKRRWDITTVVSDSSPQAMCDSALSSSTSGTFRNFSEESSSTIDECGSTCMMDMVDISNKPQSFRSPLMLAGGGNNCLNSEKLKIDSEGPLRNKNIYLDNVVSISDSFCGSDVRRFFKIVRIGNRKKLEVFLKGYTSPVDNESFPTVPISLAHHPLCDCPSCARWRGFHNSHGSETTTYLPSEVNVLRGNPWMEARNENGETGLYIACLLGHSELAFFFLEGGAEPNARNDFGDISLHAACVSGFQNIVLLLLHYQASVEIENNAGQTALHVCTSRGHVGCVKALLTFYSMLPTANVNQVDRDGNTSLHLAAKWGFDIVVDILLQPEVGVDLSIVNKQGMLALDMSLNCYLEKNIYRASISPRFSAPARLPVPGGIVSLRRTASSTFSNDLSCESMGASSSVVDDYHVIYNGNVDWLMEAVRNYDVRLIVRLLDINLTQAEIDFFPENITATLKLSNMQALSDKDNLSAKLCNPLCQCDKCSFIQIQITSRCNEYSTFPVDINALSSQGECALHISSARDILYPLVRLLCSRSANISLVNPNNGASALHIAASGNSVLVAQELLARGAEVDMVDGNGRTPLHISAIKESFNVAVLLIKFGASLAKQDSQGNTPLHLAASQTSLKLVCFLVEAGAEKNVQNIAAERPIDKVKDPAIKKYLTEIHQSSTRKI